jgi:hypothetical protein
MECNNQSQHQAQAPVQAFGQPVSGQERTGREPLAGSSPALAWGALSRKRLDPQSEQGLQGRLDKDNSY